MPCWLEIQSQLHEWLHSFENSFLKLLSLLAKAFFKRMIMSILLSVVGSLQLLAVFLTFKFELLVNIF